MMIKEGSTVCCLGDSLTEMGFWIYDANGYLSRIGSKTRFFNCGIGGNRVSMAPYYLEDEVLWYKPDYVLVMFGANDICPYLYSRDRVQEFSGAQRTRKQQELREKYATNLEITCRLLKQRGAEVIIMQPPPFDAYESHFPTEVCYGCNDELKIYGSLAAEVAKKLGLYCIDIFDALDSAMPAFDAVGETLHVEDRVHPNENGFHVIAAAVLNRLGWDVEIPKTLAEVKSLPFEKTKENDSRWETEKILRLLSFMDYGYFNPENERTDRIRDWEEVAEDLVNRSINNGFDYWMDQNRYKERTKGYVLNRPRKNELRRLLVRQTHEM